MRVPPNRWMVYNGTSRKKGMMTGGTLAAHRENSRVDLGDSQHTTKDPGLVVGFHQKVMGFQQFCRYCMP